MILHTKGTKCAYCGEEGRYDYEPCYKSIIDAAKYVADKAERTAKECKEILKEQHENNCVKIALLQSKIDRLEREMLMGRITISCSGCNKESK